MSNKVCHDIETLRAICHSAGTDAKTISSDSKMRIAPVYLQIRNQIENDPTYRYDFLRLIGHQQPHGLLTCFDHLHAILHLRAKLESSNFWRFPADNFEPSEAFSHYASELLEREPTSLTALYATAVHSFWSGLRPSALRSFLEASKHPHHGRFVADDWMGSSTCREIHASQPERHQPDVTFHLDGETNRNAVFCSFDGIYFEVFALPLLQSIQHLNSYSTVKFGAHFHVINPANRFLEVTSKLYSAAKPALISLLITSERFPVVDGAQFACNRFLRIPFFQQHTQSSYLSIDADAYFLPPSSRSRLDLDPLTPAVARQGSPNKGSYLPWRHVAAGVSWFPCCSSSNQYLANVCSYIDGAWSKTTSNWWIDQTALAIAFFAILDEFGPDHIGVLRGSFWSGVATTSEAYKLARLKEHPDVAHLMAMELPWQQALRQAQTQAFQ